MHEGAIAGSCFDLHSSASVASILDVAVLSSSGAELGAQRPYRCIKFTDCFRSVSCGVEIVSQPAQIS